MALADTLGTFRLNAFYRNPQRDRSSFTSGNERSALWFYENPLGRDYLIQSQAPHVIRQIQRAFGSSVVDGRFGPQTLAAVRAAAAQDGITFPNQLTPEVMAYALRRAFHGGVGTVVLPARNELPNVDRPNLAPSSSTFVGALDIATGQAVPLQTTVNTPAAPSPTPSPSPVPQPGPTPVGTTTQRNLTESTNQNTQPAQTSEASMFWFPMGLGGLSSLLSGFPGLSVDGSLAAQGMASASGAQCPPCNTVGPDGQCKPQDPRDCDPATDAARRASANAAAIAATFGLNVGPGSATAASVQSAMNSVRSATQSTAGKAVVMGGAALFGIAAIALAANAKAKSRAEEAARAAGKTV